MKESESRQQTKSLGVPGLKSLVIDAGRNVFEQGTPAHQAFYIEEGRVEVKIADGEYTVTVSELGPGEIFGEMGVLDNRMRSATITTMEKTKFTIIARKELEDRVTNINDPIIKSMIETLVKRLSEANAKQLNYYKALAAFQDRLAGLSQSAGETIAEDQRDAFSAEVTPLLDQLDAVLKKYRKS